MDFSAPHPHPFLPFTPPHPQVRFPILLVLNKADMATSHDHIRRVRQALPYEPAVAVSAASERWLCVQKRAGRVRYEEGGSRCTIAGEEGPGEEGAREQQAEGRGEQREGEEEDDGEGESALQLSTPDSNLQPVTAAPTAAASNPRARGAVGAPTSDGSGGRDGGRQLLSRQLEALQRKVLGRYGGTGVLLAVTAAVAMRPPRVAFPVCDLHTCTAIPARGGASAGGVLGSGAEAKVRGKSRSGRGWWGGEKGQGEGEGGGEG